MCALRSREPLTDPESFSRGNKIRFSFGILLSKRQTACEISAISMGVRKTGKPWGPVKNSAKCALEYVFNGY